jgi:hypothetical protein
MIVQNIRVTHHVMSVGLSVSRRGRDFTDFGPSITGVLIAIDVPSTDQGNEFGTVR